MRIDIKKREVVRGQAGDVPAESTASYEVPNTTIAKLSAIVGVVLTLIQALSSLLTAWVVDIPRGQAQIELGKAQLEMVESNFKLQMLQRVLEDPDATQRANSLKLLLATGLLSDPKDEIKNLANTPANTPSWKERELESLKETLPLLSGARPPQEAATPQKNTNGNSNTNKNGNSNTNTNTNKNRVPVDPPSGG